MALHPGEQKRHFSEESPVVEDPIRRALEEDEDWYRDLVEHSRDLLCVHDLEGRLLSINPVPARLLGYSVEEMLQKPMRDFIDPQFRDQFDAYLREIARAGQADGLLALLTRSGEQRIWEYHNTLRTEGVETPIARGIAHDVTERMRAEKALRAANEQLLKTAQERERVLRELTLFRTLLDQANDAIQVLDPETLRFLDVNERACMELGYSREELLSMTVFDIDKDINEASRARVRRQVRESGFAIMERVHRRKDGTTFPVEVNFRKVQLEREYGVAVTRDITERKRAEAALRQSEAELKEAQRVAHVGSWTLDMKTGKVIWSDELCSILGLDSSVVVRPFSEHVRLYTPESWARLTAAVDQAMRTGAPYELELETVRTDGSHGWAEARGEPVRGADGTITGLRGVARDITERKRAEAKLRTASLYTRSLIEASVDPLATISRDGKITDVNEATVEATGVARDRLIGSDFCDNFTDPEGARRGYQQVFAEGMVRDYPLVIRHVSGKLTDVLYNASVFKNEAAEVEGVFATARDVTERKRVEEMLRIRNERYGMAQAIGRVGNWEYNLETQEFWGSDEAKRIYGFDPGQLNFPADEIENCIPERERVHQALVDLIEADKPYNLEFEIHPRNSSEPRIIASVAQLQRDESGNHRKVVGVIQDITARKQAEEALRESEQRFRAVYARSPIGIALVESRTGRILQVNPKYCEITGRGEEELVGMDVRTITHPDDVGNTSENLRQLANEQRPNYEMDKRYVRPDGSVRWVRVQVVPMWGRGQTDRWHMGLVQDITERKQAEEALRTSEREQHKIAEQLEIERARLIEAQAVAKVGSWEVELPSLDITWSEQTHRIFETDPSSFHPRRPGFVELVHPEDRAKLDAAFAASLEKGTPATVEYRTVMADGRVKVLEEHWKVFQDGQGRPARLVGTCQDVTERKRTEEALRQSEERFRVALKHSPISVFNQDRDLRYTWMYNP
ncbi:MAG: PAS domain S-box protein, partial [Terriglobales bacterium]